MEAGNKAAQEAGFKIKYLITLNRGKQDEEGMYNLYKAISSLNLTDIVGIDLAGTNRIFLSICLRIYFLQFKKTEFINRPFMREK